LSDYQVTIIGAGVVGLAIAATISKTFSDVLLVEKHSKFGQETSSRNSEVIHSGIYYPQNSLKAKLCVAGRELIYQYCEDKGIKYKKCGKFVVACNEGEKKHLDSILEQSKKNGVNDGRIISSSEMFLMEPNVKAHSAIHFPSSGIIDSHGLMKQLESDSVLNGTSIVYNTNVVSLKKIDKGFKILTHDIQTGNFEFTSDVVINAAGLYSFEISSSLGLNKKDYQLHFWKGEYFSLHNGKNKLINSLIYPIPNSNITGLGVHATIDLNGGVKLGPNAIFLKDKPFDYKVDEENKLLFYNSAKNFLPFLELNDIHPDQAGIRPKLQKPGEPFRDFIISNEVEYGYPNFVNLIGIESPGLTSCLSIANYVDKIIFRN